MQGAGNRRMMWESAQKVSPVAVKVHSRLGSSMAKTRTRGAAWEMVSIVAPRRMLTVWLPPTHLPAGPGGKKSWIKLHATTAIRQPNNIGPM
jgi:hypothetical protein